MDVGACETPMSDHIFRFWQHLETEHVRILLDLRRDTSSVVYWDSSSFSDAVAKALVAERNALRHAVNNHRELLQTLDRLYQSAHEDGRQEIAAKWQDALDMLEDSLNYIDRTKGIIEQCAAIADPWPGFYPQTDATEADKAVIAVRIQIAAAIRALAVTSHSHDPQGFISEGSPEPNNEMLGRRPLPQPRDVSDELIRYRKACEDIFAMCRYIDPQKPQVFANSIVKILRDVRYGASAIPSSVRRDTNMNEDQSPSNEFEHQILEALTIAADVVCETKCPSVWKTGEKPPHSDECKKVRAARSAWMDFLSYGDLTASGGLADAP